MTRVQRFQPEITDPQMGCLYHTDLWGVVKIVGKDYCRVLIETTERKTDRPEWPQTINPGYRDWVGRYALGPSVSLEGRGGAT